MKIVKKIKSVIFWKYLYLILYFLISIAVLGRLLGPGYVLTLDMTFAPKMQVTELFFGLKESIATLSIPFKFVQQMITNIISMQIFQKLSIIIAVFISGISLFWLCPSESRFGKYFSGLVYMINPFLYVRFLAGHYHLLLAYAVSPIAILVFLKYLKKPDKKRTIQMVLCTTIIAVLNIHTLTLLLFSYIILFSFKFAESHLEERLHLLLKPSFFASGIFLLLNLYWILPVLSMGSVSVSQIGSEDITTFAPKPSSNFNIAFTIASLYGFWRGGYTYTKDLLPFWYLFFIFILFLVVHGAVTAYNDKTLGTSTKAFITIAVTAFILGIGDTIQSTAPIFNWLFEHVFFFRGFRDSHKFVALLVLAYAYLGGLGVDNFVKNLKGRGIKKEQILSVMVVALALSTPFIYSFSIFGFHGQLKPVDYPENWYEVNELLNQDNKDFNVLFFPWHMYMDFDWIENKDKRIANPAHSFFDKPTIQGDNMEVGTIYSQSTDPISRYIEFLLQNRNNITNFGELVAPINVKYIILAKEVDYKKYDFLYNQEDLELVSEGENLIVFKNKHDTTKISEVDTISYIQDYDDLLKVSKEQDITNALYILDQKKEINPPNKKAPLNYTKKSPVNYEIEKPKMKYVIFTTSQGISSDHWELEGATPVKNLGLTPAFIIEEETGNEIEYKIKYKRFYNTYLPGYIISLITFVALIYIYLADRVKINTKK